LNDESNTIFVHHIAIADKLLTYIAICNSKTSPNKTLQIFVKLLDVQKLFHHKKELWFKKLILLRDRLASKCKNKMMQLQEVIVNELSHIK